MPMGVEVVRDRVGTSNRFGSESYVYLLVY